MRRAGEAFELAPILILVLLLISTLMLTRRQKHGWPVGPLLAQSAHAATAVLHLYKDHADVKRYLEGEDGRGWEVMRKVTYEVCSPLRIGPDHSPARRACMPAVLYDAGCMMCVM